MAFMTSSANETTGPNTECRERNCVARLFESTELLGASTGLAASFSIQVKEAGHAPVSMAQAKEAAW
jgi:hypothetical protein